MLKKNRQEKKADQRLDQHVQAIQQMKRENSNLKEEISIEYRENKQQQKDMNTKLERIHLQGYEFAQKLERENRRTVILIIQMHLQDQIDNMDSYIEYRQKELLSSTTEDLSDLKKKTKNLDYKLEKKHQKHNQAQAEIKKLKEDVNQLRRERVIFDNVFKKLEYDLKYKQQEFYEKIKQQLKFEQESKDKQDELNRIQQNTLQEKDYYMKSKSQFFFFKFQLHFSLLTFRVQPSI